MNVLLDGDDDVQNIITHVFEDSVHGVTAGFEEEVINLHTGKNLVNARQLERRNNMKIRRTMQQQS